VRTGRILKFPPMTRPRFNSAEVVRLTTVQVLGAIFAALGALIALTSPVYGPTFKIFSSLPIWPEILGWTLFVLGIALGFACVRGNDAAAWRLLVAAAAWHTFIGSVFVITWIRWVAGDQETAPPTVYPVAMYVGFAALSLIHAEAARSVLALKRGAARDE